MEEGHSFIPPQPRPPRPAHPKVLGVLIFFLILVALIGSSWFLVRFTDVDTWVTALFSRTATRTQPTTIDALRSDPGLPSELRSAAFVTGVRSNRALSTPSGVLIALTDEAGKVSVGNQGAVIVRDEETDEYVLRKDDQELFRSTVRIDGPSVSPDRSMLAFSRIIAEESVQTESDERLAAFAAYVAVVNPARWEILLQKDNVTNHVATGYAPLIVSDTAFLYMATSGIHRYDVRTGESLRLLEHSFSTVLSPVLVSPDRTLIAFRDPTTSATLVYRVGETSLVLVREVSEFLVSPALSNDALYDVRGTRSGGEVWKYVFISSAEPKRIYTFPVALAVTRIVF